MELLLMVLCEKDRYGSNLGVAPRRWFEAYMNAHIITSINQPCTCFPLFGDQEDFTMFIVPSILGVMGCISSHLALALVVTSVCCVCSCSRHEQKLAALRVSCQNLKYFQQVTTHPFC